MATIELVPQALITDEEWDFYLSKNPYDYLLSISKSLRNNNRFFVDNHFLKLIYTLASCSRTEMNFVEELTPWDGYLYRARIYREVDALERLKNEDQYTPFQGYNEKDSFVPPESVFVSEGRINPSNIRYLYTSEDPETCILEVRPKPEDFISVAKIQLLETLHLFTTAYRAYAFWDSDDESIDDWCSSFSFALMGAFQRPYRESGDYLLCQFVSEYLKNLGFDGIVFSSSFDSCCLKKNFTVFNYEKCKVVSSKLYEVVSMNVVTYPSLSPQKGEEK